MLADYHIHTEFSDDSMEPMENVVKGAIAGGFDEICFTDHVDYGIKQDYGSRQSTSRERRRGDKPLMNVDYPAYFAEIKSLRRRYGDEITIRQGLEFGIQSHTIRQYQKLYDTWPLDFVILSCHQVDDQEFWTYEFQKGRTPEEYNRLYYEAIDDCISQYQDYCVVGHLDMIQRYNNPVYPFEHSREMLAKILSKVIAAGKGIEVNTSSFRYGLLDLMPERAILRLYHQLGGEIITIGSDCHKAADLGHQIPYVKNELKKIGFTRFCTFEKMKPVFHQL